MPLFFNLIKDKSNIIEIFKIKRLKYNVVRCRKIVFKVTDYQYDTGGC